MSVQLFNKINMDKLGFNQPITNSYGGKMSKVTYDNKWPLVQTPLMKCPFGLSEYQSNDESSKTYSMDLSINTDEAKQNEFLKFIKNLEDALVEHVSKNSEDWIDTANAPKEVCKALLRPVIKYSRDKSTKKIDNKYPPRIKVAVPFYEEKMKFKVFKKVDNENFVELNTLEEVKDNLTNSLVKAIIRYDKITFNGGKYGFKFTLQQLFIEKCFNNNNLLDSMAFIEDDD